MLFLWYFATYDQILLCRYHNFYLTPTTVAMVRKQHLYLAVSCQQAQNAGTPMEMSPDLLSGCLLVMRHCGPWYLAAGGQHFSLLLSCSTGSM